VSRTYIPFLPTRRSSDLGSSKITIMANIFNPDVNEQLVKRLEKLNPESQPKWGVMNVAQMLRHCQKPMDVAEGKLKLKRNLLSLDRKSTRLNSSHVKISY